MENGIQTQMELLLNSNKIKYTTLDRMVREVRLNNTINIYFDVNSLFDILYRSNNLELFHTISKNDYYTISSQLVNTIAHYRHYFYSRHQKSTVFYLVYSNELPSKYFTSLCKEYKNDVCTLRFNKSNTNTMNLQNNIARNINLTKSLVQYIPDAFFIDTGKNEVGPTIQYLIATDNSNGSNLVYTNDKVMYQLVNNENTFIINNKQENSKFITQGNLYKTLTKKDDITMSSYLYKVILSFTGFKKYNVSGVKGVQNLKAIKLLDKAIDNDILLSKDYNSISEVLDNMIKAKIIKEENKEVIERNFKLFNYNMQVKTFSDFYLDNIDTMFINKTDYDQLMIVSNKYYSRQPLMFLELMETFNK